MLQKGIVEKIIDKYSCKVRIPKYDKLQSSVSGTSTNDLPTAIISAMPGTEISYVVGDVVLLSFENDELNKPVILGLLYRKFDTESAITVSEVQQSIDSIESKLNSLETMGVYTHVKYSNDNGLTFTSLYNSNYVFEYTDEEKRTYCSPYFANAEVKTGINIDKDSKIIIWSVVNDKGINVTNDLSIETTLFDSTGQELLVVPYTEKSNIISISNMAQAEGKVYVSFKIYASKSYLDTLHITLNTDKNLLGDVAGEYLGICTTNTKSAPTFPNAYSWFSFNDSIINIVNNAILNIDDIINQRVEALRGDIQSEISDNQTYINYKNVEWTQAEVDKYTEIGYEDIWTRSPSGYQGDVSVGNILYIIVHNTTNDSYGRLAVRATQSASEGADPVGVVQSFDVSGEVAIDALVRFKSDLLAPGTSTLIYGGHITTNSITVDQLTVNNLESDDHKNWINLHEGTFQYANNPDWSSATRGLSWDGNSLSVKADLLNIEGTRLQPSELISNSTTYYKVETSEDAVPDIDDPDWTTIPPVWRSDIFIWTKVIVTYTDDTPISPHKSVTGPVRLTGNTGPTGSSGTGYTILLTNESHTFAGTSTSAIGASTTTSIIAYRDSTQVPTSIGNITGIPTGMSVTKNNNGTTNSSLTINVTSSMVTANGMLTIPITVDEQTFNKNFVYSIAFSGTPGESATVYALNLSAAAISKDTEGNYTPSTITLTGKSQSAGNLTDESISLTSYSGRFIIETTNNLSTSPIEWTEVYRSTNNESAYTYTIPSDAGGLRCSMYLSGDNPWTPNPNYLVDQQIVPVVYDGEDNVMVQVLSSNGDVFKNNVISTSLTAKVYKGGQNITDFIDDSKFSWIKINSDESIDPTWSKTGKIIKLTSSDVSSRATFICTVSI